jgi:hypothetical protein
MPHVLVDDELIGRNVLRLRGERSQKDVADAMRELGYLWSQTTVWKVEQGTRSLRLHEAEALARVLGASQYALTMNSEESELHDANAKVSRAHAALDGAIDTYLDALEELTVVLQTRAAGSARVETSRDWLKHDPASVVADVERRRRLEEEAEAKGYERSDDGERHEATER